MYPMIGSSCNGEVVITMAGGLVDANTVLESFKIFHNLSGWLPEPVF